MINNVLLDRNRIVGKKVVDDIGKKSQKRLLLSQTMIVIGMTTHLRITSFHKHSDDK